MSLTILTWTVQQDIQDARNLISRTADELPLNLAEKAAQALSLLDDIENALADGGCSL